LLSVSSHVSLFMNTDPIILALTQKKTARHETISRLCPSAFVRKEVCNEFFQIVVNEGRRTRMGYGFRSRCFVLIRARIWVSIHKQLDMNL
jgi:hypothetical protein